MNEDKQQGLELLEFRLNSIESEIRELKNLLIQVPLIMDKLNALTTDTKEELDKLNNKIDISNSNIEKKLGVSLSGEVSRIEEKIKTNEDALRMEARNRMEQVEKRLDAVEINIDLLNKKLGDVKDELTKVKEEPVRHQAKRWNYIVDYVYKGLVAVAIGYFFYLLNLPV